MTIRSMLERMVSDMKFDELVNLASKKTDLNAKEAVRHVRSYQYRMSLDILGTRKDEGLTVLEAAKRTGMSEKDYMSFENGTNLDANKDEYKEVLERLSQNPNIMYAIKPAISKESTPKTGRAYKLSIPLVLNGTVVAQF